MGNRERKGRRLQSSIESNLSDVIVVNVISRRHRRSRWARGLERIFERDYFPSSHLSDSGRNLDVTRDRIEYIARI